MTAPVDQRKHASTNNYIHTYSLIRHGFVLSLKDIPTTPETLTHLALALPARQHGRQLLHPRRTAGDRVRLVPGAGPARGERRKHLGVRLHACGATTR